jgi:3'-phosphoadenosine 5'-phosphosulfate sulfotransferase (PAPS reductase)/FAD synthetase
MNKHAKPGSVSLTHLPRLESESIHIMREVISESEKPVMLYSVGKDSAVMLHLARKAFFPATPPFPLLHVDTTWKFRAMYTMRDAMVKSSAMQLIVHQNPDAAARGINPFDHGSLHTDLWKTEGLKQALTQFGFDVAFGGARRDEEKSRAKERIFSFRSANHRWDPKNQRPELWNIYNSRKLKGESIWVFPLSNWTNSTSGSTYTLKTYRSYRCILPRPGQPWSTTACSSWSTTIAFGCVQAKHRLSVRFASGRSAVIRLPARSRAARRPYRRLSRKCS